MGLRMDGSGGIPDGLALRHHNKAGVQMKVGVDTRDGLVCHCAVTPTVILMSTLWCLTLLSMLRDLSIGILIPVLLLQTRVSHAGLAEGGLITISIRTKF